MVCGSGLATHIGLMTKAELIRQDNQEYLFSVWYVGTIFCFLFWWLGQVELFILQGQSFISLVKMARMLIARLIFCFFG